MPSEDNIHIVMEYVSHGTLEDFCREESQALKESTVIYIMQQLFQGINYLHKKGICHRDLKPMNILVEDYNIRNDPYVKITDFGFATIFGEDTETMNYKLGSPTYMAPELIKREEHNEKVDVWALGIIAFQLLSNGKSPWG